MQKTIAIAATLLLGIFIGVFSVSAGSKRIRQKTATTAKTETLSPVAATAAKIGEEKPLFYTSVGGSAPSSDGPAAPPKVSTRYTIELGTVKSQADAESMLLRLKDRGIDGFYTPMRRSGQVVFHVRIGLFANSDDAEHNLKKIIARSKVTGRVTKLH
jgi:cell division septation protein DedD